MERRLDNHFDFLLSDLMVLGTICGISISNGFGIVGITEFRNRLKLWLLMMLIHIGVALIFDSYEVILKRGYLKELEAVLRHLLLFYTMIMLVLLLVPTCTFYISKRIVWEMLFTIVMVYLERLLWKRYLKQKFSKEKHVRTILLVSDIKEAERLLYHLTEDNKPIRNFKIVGIAMVDQAAAGGTLGTLEIRAGRNDLLEYVKKNIIDEVILDISGDPKFESDLARELLELGVKVHIYIERIYEQLPNRTAGKIGNLTVMTVQSKIVTTRERIIKRGLDIVGSIMGLCFTVLVGILIAPMIYRKSPGKILYAQIRVGKNGRKFKMYKFRSMYPDAEIRRAELETQNEMKGHMFKMDRDPRVIPGIGTFIRKTSLDEFPQFFNVLIGDMSLVGTRPPTVDEYEKYELHHKKRISIRPGITGLWQISGRNDITDFEDVVKLDNQYIDNFSLELDFKILVKTVLQVFSGRGAK